jgi:nucleoredoxin
MKRHLRLLLTAALLPLSLNAAAQFWTNLDGQKMEAEFIARKGDYVSFKKTDGSRYLYPYERLTLADKARIDALAGGGNVVGSAPSSNTGAASATPPAPAAKAAPVASKFARQLTGKLVFLKGKSLLPVPATRLDGTKFYAIYYSAHWCPPCRAFTPELVEAYNKIKARRPEFELIFVSSDQDEGAMKDYMVGDKMPWPALKYSDARSGRLLPRPDNERGIPNLVFVDADGKDLSTSYTADGDYLGPRKVLKDIQKHFKL